MDTKKLSEISLIFIALVILIGLLQWFSSLLRPLAIAFILSLILTPMIRLDKKDRKKKIIKLVFSIIFIIGFFITFTITSLNSTKDLEINQNITNENQNNSNEEYIINFFNQEINLIEYIDVEKIEDTGSQLVNSLFNGFTSFISEFFLIIIFLMFLLPIQSVWMKEVLKKGKKNHLYNMMITYEDRILTYFKSKALISFGTALSSLLVMLLLDIEGAFFFAIIMFILNFIPTFGDYITFTIILTIQIFNQGIDLTFILLVISLLAIQMIWGNIIEPKFTGKKLSISPIIVIISIIFWGFLWGVGGMFFAIPLTLALQIGLEEYKLL